MKMTSAQASNGLLGQLSQFWSMLDELSENDPAGYRRLVEAQRQEGAHVRLPPQLHASLRTEALVNSSSRINHIQDSSPLVHFCDACLIIVSRFQLVSSPFRNLKLIELIWVSRDTKQPNSTGAY